MFPCSDPLQGTFEFSKAAGGELASVREPIIDASILFYPVLYFYHEADAAWNALKRAALNINPAANLQSAAGKVVEHILTHCRTVWLLSTTLTVRGGFLRACS